MTIREASPADLPGIAAIQAACPEAAQWAPGDYLKQSCLVADMDGEVAAFLVSRETAPGEHEILNLATGPRWRGKGFARALIKTAAHGPQQTWFLEVRESNQAAIALYTSAGFRRTGHRENYYRDPVEAAIVMRRFS